MNPEQVELYQRVQEFRFDADGATYTFAQRLAKENGWSAALAGRVIEEYRRFAFLAATAGHPVSPSDAVDQAWHLHLLYTRSYWDEFCGKVLHTPLHHEPSTGGGAERAKFEDWYGRTLRSYRRFFAEDPPADLWPSAGTKPKHREFRRVDVAGHWVVPKPRLGGRVAATGAALVLMLVIVAVGCARAMGTTTPGGASPLATALAFSLNPFDLTGPRFLALYFAAFAAACLVGWLIRSAARGGAGLPSPKLRLDPYEVAYLNGGAVHAVNAAIASLCHREILRTHEADGTLSVLLAEPPQLHPLEQSIFYAVDANGRKSRRTIREVRVAARPTVQQIADELRNAGLVVNEGVARAASAWGLVLTLLVPGMGLVKVGVGLLRDKPVSFLMLSCIATTVLALFLFGRWPHRTRLGDGVLRGLRSAHNRVRTNPIRATPDAFALGVAIFGLSFLADTHLASLRRALTPRNTSFADAGGSSCSSSSACGNSSCGGSGGGGGSSCGGGGCGGCGGD